MALIDTMAVQVPVVGRDRLITEPWLKMLRGSAILPISLTTEVTGTLKAAQFPALTGDVTTVSGALATAIGVNKVTLPMMAQIATASVLGRNTALTGDVEVLTTLPNAVQDNITRLGTLSSGTVPVARISGILPGANGGTNNGFLDFTGPATALKTFTLPNASATILTSNAAVTVPQGGTGLVTLGVGRIPTGNGTSAFESSADLTYSSGTLTVNAGSAITNLRLSSSAGFNPTFRFADGDVTPPDYSATFTAPPLGANDIAFIGSFSGTLGGVQFAGLTDVTNTGTPFALIGHHGGTAPTTPAVLLTGFKHNGTTGRSALAGTEIVCRVATGISGQIAADFLANGNTGFGGNTSPTARIHPAAGTATASTAPLKFTSGPLMTTAEAMAVEALTDNLHFTITTGAARKGVMLDDGTRLTSGRVPIATTNGRLTDDADLTFATDTLTATKLVGTTSVKAGTVAGFISSDGSAGATGSFTTVDGKTVTVKDGIITAIV